MAHTLKPTPAQRKTIKRMRDRNRRFAAMSVERQRITIAKDVLAMLATKKILPQSDAGYTDLDWYTYKYKPETPLDALIATRVTTCDVCAVGAMFVATVMRHNCIALGDFDDLNWFHDIAKYLKKFFPKAQLALIEAAFEGTVINGNAGLRKERAACEFRDRLPNDRDRLKAIMENIIANNGTFVL